MERTYPQGGRLQKLQNMHFMAKTSEDHYKVKRASILKETAKLKRPSSFSTPFGDRSVSDIWLQLLATWSYQINWAFFLHIKIKARSCLTQAYRSSISTHGGTCSTSPAGGHLDGQFAQLIAWSTTPKPWHFMPSHSEFVYAPLLQILKCSKSGYSGHPGKVPAS